MAKAFKDLNVYIDEKALVGFGKHEGETWAYVVNNYPDYIIWCIGNMDSPPLFSRDFIIRAIKHSAQDKKAGKRAYGEFKGGSAFVPTHVLEHKYATHGLFDDSWGDDVPF